MARSNLTTIIQRVSAIAEQIHALPEDERNYLLDLLLPEAEVKLQRKRKRKATTTTSTRRRGLSDQVKGTSAPTGPLCATCGNVEGYQDHSQPSPSYHPFAPSASAQRAAGKSSPKNEAAGSTASDETETATAPDVAKGASGD